MHITLYDSQGIPVLEDEIVFEDGKYSLEPEFSMVFNFGRVEIKEGETDV